MISHRITVVILIVTAMLLVAGCVGHTGNGKNRGNVPSTVVITSLSPTPIQTEPLQISPEGYYWIKIDHISDKYVDESFTITSTTNLSAGEEILVQVYSGTHFNGPKMQTWKFYGATGTVRVIQGINGSNTISFVIDSTTLYDSSPLEPDEYIVTEDALRQEASGSALFNVNPRPVRHPGIWDLW
jgi:hypothetical protein